MKSQMVMWWKVFAVLVIPSFINLKKTEVFEKMNLVDWAKEELNRLVTDDSDGAEMQKAMNKDILQVVEVFANQGHSGFSASYALGILKNLLAYKPITPLTGGDDEWCSVEEWNKDDNTQQNKRCFGVFRKNFDNSTAYYMGGKVFSDDGGESWYTCVDSRVPVTFPYTVPEKPEYIILENKTE